MSDTGSDKPLTRRERRLLEMQQNADQSGAPLEHDSETPTWDPIDEETIVPSAGSPETPEAGTDDDIEIDESLIDVPTTDADGNPLSRREVRQLRQAAIEELRAQKRAELAEVAAETEAAEAQPVEEPAALASTDTPTESLSLEDLREIAEDSNVAVDPPAPDEDVDVLEQLIEDADVDTAAVESPDTGTEREDQEAQPEAVSESDGEEQDEPVSPTVPDEDGYTFPDIKPLEVERPVFDDPSVRTVGTPDSAGQGTGFDDMIERAVADENASVHTGASSLILPSIPGTDGLSGPIGSTGELFITGSFELPKSIGETGGHAHLQESISKDEAQDPVEMLGLTDVYETSEFDSAPVSASRAVSTRSLDKSGITTPEVQNDNKKSMILIGTGGGLILLLVGAGIWAIQSGLFG